MLTMISGSRRYQVVDNNAADGNDGTDTISGVEFFEFADMTYNTVTGNLSNTSSGGALGGSASAPRPQSRLQLLRRRRWGWRWRWRWRTTGGRYCGVDGSSMMTSAKFAAHGLEVSILRQERAGKRH